GFKLLIGRTRFELVKAFENALLDLWGHGWHPIILVVERQVIENVLALLVHPPHSVADDDCDFVSKSRVIGDEIRDGAHNQVAVAILMLEAFPIESSSAGGGAEEKSLGHNVAGQPHQIADALVAEHRVINIERDEMHTVCGV